MQNCCKAYPPTTMPGGLKQEKNSGDVEMYIFKPIVCTDVINSLDPLSDSRLPVGLVI